MFRGIIVDVESITKQNASFYKIKNYDRRTMRNMLIRVERVKHDIDQLRYSEQGPLGESTFNSNNTYMKNVLRCRWSETVVRCIKVTVRVYLYCPFYY